MSGTSDVLRPPPPSSRARWLALVALLVTLIVANGGLVALAWFFHQTVAPGWKKGPLIDPASPYAPENAMVLFGFASCVVLDAYVLGLVWVRARATRPRAWMACAVLVVSLVLGEAGLRGWLASDMVTYFRPDPVLHWVVRPNLRDFDNLKGGGKISTNADGMRDVSVPRAKPADAYRVLVLGDSSNFGHGVEGNETLSSALQRLVPTYEGKRVEVLNGATPGWTTYQGLAFARGIGGAYAPDLILAGFNNDSGPEYLGDAARVPGPVVRSLNAFLFRSELYLLGREVTLAMARRAAGTASVRQAGDEPVYGKLGDTESRGLVPRITLPEFLKNLEGLQESAPRFAWINMPVQRELPNLVERYVNPAYREAAATLGKERGFAVVDVDARWQATRERGLFQFGHVFHPNATGHARLAQQVARELFDASVVIEGPVPRDPRTVTLGISTLTPVHAHVAVVLAAHPELAEAQGLVLDVRSYASGKGQGEDVANGTLDAFFTCEVPAIRMLESRADSFVVGSPGVLGRIAVVGRVASLAELRGKRVGVSPGSTPAMDWETWGAGLGATTVPLDTDAQAGALARGEVDALVGWDPWVANWLANDASLHVLAERPFHSELAVSSTWALGKDGDPRPRAARLVALVESALVLAAMERTSMDAAVATLSGWPVGIVTAVADQNAALAPTTKGATGGSLTHEEALRPVREGLTRAARFARVPIPVEALFATELLQGKVPPRTRGSGPGPLPPLPQSGGKPPPAGPPLPPDAGTPRLPPTR